MEFQKLLVDENRIKRTGFRILIQQQRRENVRKSLGTAEPYLRVEQIVLTWKKRSSSYWFHQRDFYKQKSTYIKELMICLSVMEKIEKFELYSDGKTLGRELRVSKGVGRKQRMRVAVYLQSKCVYWWPAIAIRLFKRLGFAWV